MTTRHVARLALAMVALGGGCRAFSRDGFSRPLTTLAPRDNPEAREIIAKINANADKVKSLQAQPSILASQQGGMMGIRLDGQLALERPRNFRLVLSKKAMGATEEADLGSNDKQFWFWTREVPKTERYVLVCDYEESGASPLAAALQPDWIVESMGLKVIPESETASMTATRSGPNLILSTKRKGPGGEALVKETVVDAVTGQVREHRLFAIEKGKRVLIAGAIVNKTKAFPLPSSGGEGAEGSVVLPTDLRLEWSRQKLRLQVVMADLKVNPTFTADQRDLFQVPEYAGYARKDLREFAGLPAAKTSPYRERATRPAPPVQPRGAPVPLEDNDSTAPGFGGNEEPGPLGANAPSGAKSTIGDRIPTAPIRNEFGLARSPLGGDFER